MGFLEYKLCGTLETQKTDLDLGRRSPLSFKCWCNSVDISRHNVLGNFSLPFQRRSPPSSSLLSAPQVQRTLISASVGFSWTLASDWAWPVRDTGKRSKCDDSVRFRVFIHQVLSCHIHQSVVCVSLLWLFSPLQFQGWLQSHEYWPQGIALYLDGFSYSYLHFLNSSSLQLPCLSISYVLYWDCD